jgi:hypothetical protein
MIASRAKETDTESWWDHVGDLYSSLDPFLQTIITLGLVIGVLMGFFKWVRPRIKNFFSDLRAIRDTLVGRPAMRDSVTQKLLPGTALLSIGDRMAVQEASLVQIAEAVETLATNTDRITRLELTVDRIEKALTDERILGKIEGVQMLRTMERIATPTDTANPPVDKPDALF